MAVGDEKSVLHDVNVWLAPTKTWLYSEITQVQRGWICSAIAHRAENRARFPYSRVYVLRDEAGWLRWFVEITGRRLGLWKQCPTLVAYIRRHRPVILHSHFGPVGWRNIDAAAAAGAKHVVSFYGYDASQLPRERGWRRRYLEMFESVDAVLCEGPHMAGVLAALGCPTDRIHVHRLGIDLERIGFTVPSWHGARQLRLLMAARFDEKKGYPYALEALALLAAARPTLDFGVTIVGRPSSKRQYRLEYSKMKAIISRADLADRIEFHDYCTHDELLELGSAHDLFVAPSVTAHDGDTEGGAPVTIMEMAAAGLPVVSTRHCDIPFVLGAPNVDLLAPERDAPALAGALAYLIDHPQEWPSIARENRAHLASGFDVREQGKQLENLYARVFGSGDRA